MQIFKTFKTALTGLTSKKSRTFLTMLGIIIGIASVIIIMSVGAGAQSLILNEVKRAGSNLVVVFPGKSEDGPPTAVLGITITTFTLDDVKAIENLRNVPNIVAAAPLVRGIDTFTWANQSIESDFVGTAATYPDVESAPLAAGRFFNEEEESGLGKVIVLGYSVANDLFGPNDPIGQEVRIGRVSFRVIGVMEERGTQFFQNKDQESYIPISTAQKLLLGIDHVSLARFKVDSEENVSRAIADIEQTLRERHNISDPAEDDFTVSSQNEALDLLGSLTDALRFFLAGIAALSLLVGGIGIMNIMLAAVAERTREIGLRKAVGASKQDILLQFLTESVLITFVGAIIGIIIGVCISALVAFVAQYLGYDWDFVVPLSSILLAVGVAGLVGIVFGLYPARKASFLNPIEALRYE